MDSDLDNLNACRIATPTNNMAAPGGSKPLTTQSPAASKAADLPHYPKMVLCSVPVPVTRQDV